MFIFSKKEEGTMAYAIDKADLYSKNEIQDISYLFSEIYRDSRGYVKINSLETIEVAIFTIQKS